MRTNRVLASLLIAAVFLSGAARAADRTITVFADQGEQPWRSSNSAIRAASPPWLQDIIVFALNTGMRQDEILSLKWAQVDAVRRAVTVLITKNKEKRTIPIYQTVLAILTRRFRPEDAAGYVFPAHSGEKMDARNLLRSYYIARKKARLEDLRFHDLRHTFATRLVQAGIDLYVVKELLGHKTITMTMRYAHLAPEHLQEAKRLNPHIIMDRTCLMGQTGPAARLAGYGYHAAAVSGFFEVTGWGF